MYKVLKDFKGSPDGCRVIEYTKGQILTEGSDFSRDLAEVALNEKWVEPAEEDSVSDDDLMPSTVKDLKAALAELKVDIPKSAKKTDLEALWTAAQSE